MTNIISIHSFRGGTGKSNTTANLAALLAAQGWRVGVIDCDIQSPGIHALFGMEEADITRCLNDYLWGKSAIEDVAQDMTSRLNVAVKGKIYLIPSSMKTGDIARVLRDGYDVGLLNDGYKRLYEKLNLDALMIDTHPGLNQETLLSMAISNTLIIVMRPDVQDYQGTAVTVDVARQLRVARMLLLVNKTPPALDADQVRTRVEQKFSCEVAAVLPHSDEMMSLASSGIFSLHYPDHPIALTLKQLSRKLMR